MPKLLRDGPWGPSDWTQTASGRMFYPLAPRVEDVAIGDISHHLAATPRFRGATREPYSVGHHSLLASLYIVSEWHERPPADQDLTDDQFAAYGLLHDAGEAYLWDASRPIKQHALFKPFRDVEDNLQRVIYEACGLDPTREPRALKLVDRRLLRTEQRDLMPPPGTGEDRDDVDPYPTVIKPLSFVEARHGFMVRFGQLVNRGAVRWPEGVARMPAAPVIPSDLPTLQPTRLDLGL